MCIREGGKPVYRTDNRGCEFIDCIFEEEGGFFSRRCPPPEEIMQMEEKCKSFGSMPRIIIEDGCKVVRCMEGFEERPECQITYEMKEKIKENCFRQGLEVMKGFDDNGCPSMVCAGEGVCHRNMPEEEAFERCEMEGGELIVKRDGEGCIMFSECVSRGDNRDAYYEEVDEVPDETVLLQLAFKLEELRINLTSLSRRQRTSRFIMNLSGARTMRKGTGGLLTSLSQ
jgi:hypothetical protein